MIAVAVRWYLRYGLSYRHVQELLAGDCCFKRSGVQSADIQASGAAVICSGLHVFEGRSSRLVAAANPSGIA